SPDDLGWFAREGDAVWFHVSALYSHSYEDEDGDSVVVMRAFDASVPLTAPEGLGLDARCDLVDGAATPALPAFPIAGSRPTGPMDVSTTAAAPGLHPWRLPTPDRRPRLDVRAAPVDPPARVPAGPALFTVIGAFITGVGALAVALRPARSSASAPPDVTAEAAHELKTPLTVMRGNLEVALRRERAPDEYRATLASTLEEVKGLQNVVGSVLLLTRGAETPMAREPVDVVALVKGEAERLNALATDREVSLASVRGPRIVVGDPSLLARAVGNLLDNAHLHSVAGGAIRVRVEVVGDEAIVSVEDDGPGIPPTRREKVFERFWRGPEVGQRGIPGAGLGLPISRWIAEAHGGSLTLDPSIEGRARFVLRLPLGSPGS
ncbi:MAG: HAMP domain-containing histidine kinase, partial [Planctomycetia bacterium]|nr:HAMP domain-containing histidine kinase [Planctomycetia bacterium]